MVRSAPRVVKQFVEVPKIAELKPAARGETAQEETLELLKFRKVSGAGSGLVLHEVAEKDVAREAARHDRVSWGCR